MTEENLQALFNTFEGFRGARLRLDRNDNQVGFVDFETTQQSTRAKDSLQGCNGISLHFSHATSSRNKRSRDTDGHYKDKQPTGGSMMMMPETIYNPFGGLTYVPPYPPQQVPMTQSLHPSMSMASPVLPPNASSTLYVEGLPLDASEREVSHIFRPFSGYQSLRIIVKNYSKEGATEDSKATNSRPFPLCFVEYDNKWQATQAMLSLQGYRMDKNDNKGLNVTFAKGERKDRRR